MLHLHEGPELRTYCWLDREVKLAQHLGGFKPTAFKVLLCRPIIYRCATTADLMLQFWSFHFLPGCKRETWLPWRQPSFALMANNILWAYWTIADIENFVGFVRFPSSYVVTFNVIAEQMTESRFSLRGGFFLLEFRVSSLFFIIGLGLPSFQHQKFSKVLSKKWADKSLPILKVRSNLGAVCLIQSWEN